MPFIEIFCIVAGASLVAASFWFANRQGAKNELRNTTPVPSTASINHALKLQNSLNELLHELQSLSQDITDDLEEKLGQLKDLLQLADNKCEELSSAGGGNGNSNSGHVAQQQAQEALIPAEPELHLTVEDDDSPSLSSNRYQQIYQLADDGFSLEEIARHMSMGKGEIQLILSLRKKD